MRALGVTVLIAAAMLWNAVARPADLAQSPGTKLLRIPDVWHEVYVMPTGSH